MVSRDLVPIPTSKRGLPVGANYQPLAGRNGVGPLLVVGVENVRFRGLSGPRAGQVRKSAADPKIGSNCAVMHNTVLARSNSGFASGAYVC
jgi:hypothetical protein